MDNQIFNFAYLLAFRDATTRNAYKNVNKEPEETFREIKEFLYFKCKCRVHQYIRDIFEAKYPDPIECIECVCKYTHKVHNHTYNFSFGNAQKLVNMTAKYMYLACYNDEEKRILFKNCDCPMDGIMIKKVKINKEIGFTKELAWSSISLDNQKTYDYFQEQIRLLCNEEKVYLIEYDFLHWDE